jgi:hypothetical protein
VIDILYTAYTTSGSLCLFSDASMKCLECVYRGVRYDSNFSSDDFDCLDAEQQKLERAK